MAKTKAKRSKKKTSKGADETFCSSCGKIIKKEAEICPNCGVRQRGIIRKGKSKTAAVLLAVFLCFWTWCYTYQKDALKFWLGLVFDLLLFWTIIVPIGIWIWAIVDAATKDKEWYENY